MIESKQNCRDHLHLACDLTKCLIVNQMQKFLKTIFDKFENLVYLFDKPNA